MASALVSQISFPQNSYRKTLLDEFESFLIWMKAFEGIKHIKTSGQQASSEWS